MTPLSSVETSRVETSTFTTLSGVNYTRERWYVCFLSFLYTGLIVIIATLSPLLFCSVDCKFGSLKNIKLSHRVYVILTISVDHIT